MENSSEVDRSAFGPINQPLLSPPPPPELRVYDAEERCGSLRWRVWDESKKLWVIVGPAIFSRVASFSMNVITQAFAGHLGEVELASISIANTVIVGFNFGLLVLFVSHTSLINNDDHF